MSKVVYQMEIQMRAGSIITDELIKDAERQFPHTFFAIDSAEDCSAVIIMESEGLTETMRLLVKWFMDHHPSIYYMDVVYRFPYDMTPDRFVIWSDGRQQEYTGKVLYVEDE